MGFPTGNTEWQKRKTHGRPKAIPTPELFWELACDYFQWCDENPWIEKDWKGKEAFEVDKPTQRPYTWEGLENHMAMQGYDVSLKLYKKNDRGTYGDFVQVVTRVGTIIRQNKMEGAMVGAFNSNIVARDLALGEKIEIKTEEKEKDLSKLTNEELVEYAKLQRKLNESEEDA
jgi:hypothetical protein